MQDGTILEARARRAQLLGTLAADDDDDDEQDGAEGIAAGSERLQRLDFTWCEAEGEAAAAAAAAEAELAAREKQRKLQRLQAASESQQVRWFFSLCVLCVCV